MVIKSFNLQMYQNQGQGYMNMCVITHLTQSCKIFSLPDINLISEPTGPDPENLKNGPLLFRNIGYLWGKNICILHTGVWDARK